MSNQAELVTPGVEAIAVATPAATHLEVAMAAIAAGKHVLVENPLASSYAGGRALVDAAAERGVSYRCADMIAPVLPERETLQGVMGELANCIRTGRAGRTDGHSGLRVLDILEAASRSLELHGSVVPLRGDR